MATIEDKDDEQETPDAVEVAQGPVNEAPRGTTWVGAPFLHIRLNERMDNPYECVQQHAWIDAQDEVTIRSYEWVDTRQVQLCADAMEKLVDAWLARHPRELSAVQVMTYLESHPYGIMTAMNLSFDGVPSGINDHFDAEANAGRKAARAYHQEWLARHPFPDANASASTVPSGILDAAPALDLAH